MKVCLVAHRFYEINTHMRQFAAAFRGDGNVVDVIAVRRQHSAAYECIDGVNVYRIQSRNLDEDEGGAKEHFIRTGTFMLRAAAFIARQHLQKKYDLIHVQSIPDFLVFSALLPRLLGTPVILDLRDLVPELYVSKFSAKENSFIVKLLKFVEKLSARFASRVIVANPVWHDRIVGRSAPRSKCSTFWYYPDPRVFYPRAKTRADGRFLIIYPGSLHWHQGVDVAIRAFPRIMHEIPHAEFHIYGAGPNKPDLVALSHELGLAERVRFWNTLPTTEIVERMADGDLGLVPKRASNIFGNEAASTKISEFLALGIPVVASRTKVDTCLYGDSLLRFFDSENEPALAEAVISVYRNQQLRHRLIANGLAFTKSNRWDVKIRDYTNLIEELVRRPASGVKEGVAPGAPLSEAPDPVVSFYRCTPLVTFATRNGTSPKEGYFLLGNETVCYGRCFTGYPCATPKGALYDMAQDVRYSDHTVMLPFNPAEIIDNLRLERYEARSTPAFKGLLSRAYYSIRPFLPVQVRTHLQRAWVSDWRKVRFPHWPIDVTVEHVTEKLLLLSLKAAAADKVPFIWFWPKGHSACAMITHDVETVAGRDFCRELIDIDAQYGMASSFQLVPEGRYSVPAGLLSDIRDRGCEINVHDLNHDGTLFRNHDEYLNRAVRINHYGAEWRAQGFRAAVMYRVLDWYKALCFEYDMSVPNAGQLEAQRGGCCTVFPYFIGDILELPLTTTQDYAMFHFLGEYTTRLWQQQIELIHKRNGLITVLTHPDYLVDKRAQEVYRGLLRFLSDLRDHEKVWIARPGEVNAWWRARSSMKLLRHGDSWSIEGPGAESAEIAYAFVAGNRIVYQREHLGPSSEGAPPVHTGAGAASLQPGNMIRH